MQSKCQFFILLIADAIRNLRVFQRALLGILQANIAGGDAGELRQSCGSMPMG
jgi:hypothetical protein